MPYLFTAVSGKTECYAQAPVRFSTNIDCKLDATPIGTGYLVEVRADNPHVIQFVDRSVLKETSEGRKPDESLSGVRYTLSHDSGSEKRGFSVKGARMRSLDLPSDAKSPYVDEYPRIPCKKDGPHLQFFDAPGSTLALLTGGLREPEHVGEFLAVTFCLSGKTVVKIIKWTLYYKGRAVQCVVRFKEPNLADIKKYQERLNGDKRFAGKASDYMTAPEGAVEKAKSKVDIGIDW